jgi:hypothetical protein
MFPKTQGTGITTQYGNVDDQEQLLKDLFESLGWT